MNLRARLAKPERKHFGEGRCPFCRDWPPPEIRTYEGPTAEKDYAATLHPLRLVRLAVRRDKRCDRDLAD